MTYLAPRQGLFAIIVFFSFLLHAVLLTLSTSEQLDKLQTQTGERVLAQMSDEIKLALMSGDEVSLSVLAGRYTAEQGVARIRVFDVDKEMLISMGQAQLNDGQTMTRPVTLEDRVIGSVSLTVSDVSYGKILAAQWLFLLGSLIIHVLLWLLYGYVARPTKAQLSRLSQDVHNYLLTQQSSKTSNNKASIHRKIDDDDHKLTKDKPALSVMDKLKKEQREQPDKQPQPSALSDSNINIHRALGHYVQSNQNQSSPTEPSIEPLPTNQMPLADNTALQHDQNQNNSNERHGQQTAPAEYDPHRSLTEVSVHVAFIDPFNLFDKLAPASAKLYLTLCNQLFEQTCQALLATSPFDGIAIKQTGDFDKQGATVTLHAKHTQANDQLALAGVMLAKAMVMVNQVVCKDSHKLQRFALDMCAATGDEPMTHRLQSMLTNHGRRGDVLLMLPSKGIEQLKGKIQLDDLPSPTTVYERDADKLAGVDQAVMQTLTAVRRAVLLPHNHNQ